MHLCKYYPVANDRMGTIWTLSSIKGACLIEFGTSGTTHYAVEAIGSLNGQDEANIYSTHMDQSDITFGKYDRLEQAILELDENLSPKYIFIMASSISSIIGADIESVCYQLANQVRATLIPITTGGLKYQYPIGVEQTLELLVKKIVQEHPQEITKYNILGFTIDKYNYLSDVEELKRIMKELFNKDINTVFTCETSIEDIETASRASLNIVIRQEALKAAQLMKEKYGIPYIYQNLYGLQNIQAFIEAVSQIPTYQLNQTRYEQEVTMVKNHLFSVKRKFFFHKETKKCAIFGDYDTVIGLSDILKELNLEVDRQEVLHDITNETDLVSNVSEFERMKYLKEQELLILLGDGATLDMKHDSKLDVQISNPNLNQTLIYPYTPYMGFRGMLYLIEKILNIKL